MSNTHLGRLKSLRASAIQARENHDIEKNKDKKSHLKLRDSLEVALKANRSLQSTLLAELISIHQRKADNRLKVEQLRIRLSDRINSHKHNFSFTQSSSSTLPPTSERNHVTFFSGPVDGDEPNLNPHANLRKKLIFENPSTVLAVLHPLWTSQESKALEKIIAFHRNQPDTPRLMKMNAPDPLIDYDQMALQLAPSTADSGRAMHKRAFKKTISMVKSTLTSPSRSRCVVKDLVRLPRRSALECELRHRFLTTYLPWTKAESMKLVELAFTEEKTWESIMEEFKACFPSSRRSKWDCFTHFQTKLQPQRKQLVWTHEEDEFLIRYVAALGSQTVLHMNSDTLIHVTSTVLTNKTRGQVLTRMHQSLCNPKLSNDTWTANEERKLVVCLKMYHDSTLVTTDTSSALNPLTKALNLITLNQHFPHRSAKAIRDKWHKSLDPGHSSLPFTEEEDTRLVQITAEHPCLGWSELCRRFFPDRHPERIAKRWAEVASNEQLIARDQGVPLELGSNSPSNITDAASASETITKRGWKRSLIGTDGAGLSVDGFYLQVSKKKRT